MVHCCGALHSVTLTSVCRVSARLSSYPGYLQMCHIQQSIITSITMTHIYYRVSRETGILVQTSTSNTFLCAADFYKDKQADE